MADTANGAALLATARELRAHILSRRDAIEASRRLPEDLGYNQVLSLDQGAGLPLGIFDDEGYGHE